MLISAVQGCTKLFRINKTLIKVLNLKVVPTYHFKVRSFVPTLQKSKASSLKTQRNGELELRNFKTLLRERMSFTSNFRDTEHTGSCSAVCLMM